MKTSRANLNALMYHGIEAAGQRGRYSFAISEFRDHLRAIDERLGSAPSIAVEDRQLSGFALTFDDGSAGWLEASEALLERSWRAFFFVITGAIGKPGRLQRSDIRRLADMGHVVGTHSVDHPKFLSFRDDPYILDQWKRSKAELEDIIGRNVSCASVPGGFYSDRVARGAETAGLDNLFTSEPVTRSWQVGACRVFGRFALTNDMGGRTVARLAAGERFATAAQYLSWNTKKSIKQALAWSNLALATRRRPG